LSSIPANAQSPGVLFTGPAATDKFESAHAGATLVKVDKAGATYHYGKGYTLISGPGVTYQDSSGKWQVTKLQVQALANSAGWQILGTPFPLILSDLDSTHHNKRLSFGSDGAFNLQLGDISYAGNDIFTFESDKQTWSLQVQPTGTLLKTTVTSKQGSKSYSFQYTTKGPPLTVDSKGNLVAGSIRTTRAVMLTADKKTIPCGAWSADPAKISFSCDDRNLPASAFPYVIDPLTMGFGFTDNDGNLSNYNGCDGCNSDYRADFNVDVPSGITITGIDIGADVDAWGDCDTSSGTTTPSGDTNQPNQHLDWFYLHGATVTWHYGISVSQGGNSCNARVSNTHLNITYVAPSSVSVSSVSGHFGDWIPVSFTVTDPDGTHNISGASTILTVNSSPTYAGGCNFNFTTGQLLGDSGQGVTSSPACSVQGSSISLPNGCYLGCSGSVTYSINIRSNIGGTQNIYIQASNYDGQSTGWATSATYTARRLPTPISASIPNVAPGTWTTVSFTSRSLDGWPTNSNVQFLINYGADDTYACHLLYVPSYSSIGLWLGGGWWQHTIGSGGQADTAYCTLDSNNSSASMNGTDLTVNARVLFKSTMLDHPPLNGYVYYDDGLGGTSGWTYVTTGTLIPPTQTITSSPTGRTLTVDGTSCTTPCTFQWNSGTTHTIAAATQTGAAGTQYVFASWSDSGVASHTITTTSSAATYTANFTSQYYLTTTAGSGGAISPTSAWYNSGSVVSVSATPNSGYYFSAFTGDLSGTTTPQNVTLDAPKTVTASFTGMQTVTSVPTGHTLTVDGAACTTPCSFQWTPNTSHTIAAATQSGGTGTQFVFASWSDSGAASHSVTATASPATWTATFTTQYFLTTSAGTGGSILPASGWYNAGSVVAVSASANSGYQFTGFSNGLTGTTTPQNVIVNAPVTVAASFVAVYTQTFNTSPAGLSLTIDGTACTSSCTAVWAAGSTGHTIATTATQPGAAATQYIFVNWSDAGALSHSVTAPSSASTFTATFTTQYYLTTTASPAAGGTVTPASGWYNSGATPSVSATANAGYQFSSFTGDLTGATTPQNITMSAPRSVTANFIAVQTVTSVPAGLSLTVDSVACTTPCTFQWAASSTHTIAAAATIAGPTGTQYVFGTWSDSGASSHTVTAAATPITYTANFTTQYYLTTSASAGGSIAPASAWYNSGATVSVSATANAGFQFTGFTGDLSGVITPQTLTMSAAKSVTAAFAPVQTVTSVPAGLSLTVDGAACTAPCTFAWTPSSTHTIAAATNAGATGTQYVFASWSDTGAASHTITAPATPTTYTATFTTQYYVTTSVNPAAAGSISPASGWQNAGPLTISTTPNGGYQFSGFTGDITASTSPQTVTLTGPISVTAIYAMIAPFSNGYAYRRPITIDHTKVANSDQANFPVLISGTFSYLATLANGGKVTSANGYDIIFSDSTGTQLLKWEIESYNPVTGDATFWVKIPTLSATTDTVIYMYYGNSGVTTFQGGTAGSVWDTNYLAVYHLNLDPTAFGAKDSTANAKDLTAAGTWTSAQLVSGQTGKGLSFNGTNDFLDGGTTKLAVNNPFIQLWMKTSSPSATQGLVTRGQLWSSGWMFQFDGAGSFVGPRQLVDGPAGHGYAGAGSITDTNWHQVATNYTNGGNTYVDGNLVGSNGRDTDTYYAQHFVIGATDSGGARFFNGNLDEVRISKVPRSADWLKTEFNNQSSPGTFLAVGAEASNGLQYYLTTSVSPSSVGSIIPASGWYTTGSVLVTAIPNAGYGFTGFSGDLTGTANPQNLTLDRPRTATATFVPVYTVTSVPAGLSLTIDGAACTTPCQFQWTANSQHTIASSAIISAGTGIQYSFNNWSDGLGLSHTVTAPANPVTWTANFTLQYYLTTSASPSVGGSITPASGWYTSGATPSISASANALYQFTGFTGALTGTTTPQNVTMNQPVTVTANFVTAVPVWSITSQHSGSFLQGQTGATYTVTLTNQPNAFASSGTVTVTDTVSSGLTITAMSGAGWTCNFATATCARSDALAPGSSYPITVTVNVAATATSPQTNQATVTGGGGNSVTSAVDSTNITGPPTGLLASPPAASGHRQVFTFNWADPANNANITSFEVQFSNSTMTPAGSCWIRIARTAGMLYLRDDSGGEKPAVPLTSTTPVQNSQCAVNPSESSVTGAGNVASLTLSLSFFETYAGPHTIWMRANNGSDSGWLNPAQAVYTVADQAPTVDGVSPSTGRGWTQPFAFTYTDLDGVADLAYAQVMFNNSLSATNSCFIIVSLGFNGIYLMDDSGALQGPVLAGQSGTLSNSQCSVNGSGSSVVPAGNSITVNLAMTFTSAYAGSQTIWSKAIDTALVDAGWNNKGSWLVGPLQDFTVSVSPAAATVLAGEWSFHTVNLTTINGFSGAVTYQGTISPSLPGSSVTFNTLSDGSTQAAVRTATWENGGPTGDYWVTITGTSPGQPSRSTTFPLTIQDFTVTISPNKLVSRCDSAHGYATYDPNTGFGTLYQVTVNSLNNFTGSVGFGAPTVNAIYTTLTNVVSPPAVSAQGGVDTVSVSVNFNPTNCSQTFDIPITWPARAHGITHTASATMAMNEGVTPSVNITVSGDGLNPAHVIPGGTTYFVTVVNSVGTYTSTVNGDITLSVSGCPSTWSCTFSPPTISVNIFQPGVSYLTVTAPQNANPGDLSSLTIVASRNGTPIGSYSRQVTVNPGPAQITLHSNPIGLKITALLGTSPNQTQVVCNQTDCSYVWTAGTALSLTTDATQVSSTSTTTRYIFLNWDDNSMSLLRTGLQVPSQSITYTANFKTQYQLTTSVSGTGGCTGTITPSGANWYDANTQVPVIAAPNGNCTFAGFTGLSGVGASTTIAMDGPKTIVANFVPAGTVIITTVPAGLTVNVDGVDHTSPWNVLNDVAHTISVAASQPGATGTRYVSPVWSDGLPISHQIPQQTSTPTFTATYQTQFMLKVTTNPSAAGSVSYTPLGFPDATDPAATWFGQGTSVTVTPAPASGFQFGNLTDASSGAVVANPVPLNGPMALRANFGALSTVKEYIRINGRVIAIENKE
jgi:hypothetical protein